MEIARFNKRVFAFLVDYLSPMTIGAVLSYPLFKFVDGLPLYFAIIISALICYGVYLLFNVPIMYFSKGSTLGSFIFRIKTVKKDNSKLTIRSILVKHLYLGLLPFTIANAIYMLVVHTEQTLFDRITNTIVIDIKNSPSFNSTEEESKNNNE